MTTSFIQAALGTCRRYNQMVHLGGGIFGCRRLFRTITYSTRGMHGIPKLRSTWDSRQVGDF